MKNIEVLLLVDEDDERDIHGYGVFFRVWRFKRLPFTRRSQVQVVISTKLPKGSLKKEKDSESDVSGKTSSEDVSADDEKVLV